jgi:hypothetical protein
MPARWDAAAALAVRARVARLGEGLLVVGGGTGDPAVARHRRELFGVPAAPDPHPTEEPHRLLLEWVGQPSPTDAPLVLALKARGLLFADELLALARLAQRTVRRLDGITSRTLTSERDGLSETLTWGPLPGSYVRSVAFRDAERILGLFETGTEFRVVGRHRAVSPTARPDADWRRLIDAWRLARGRVPLPPDPLAIRYGPEEGLVKLHGPTGGLWHPL